MTHRFSFGRDGPFQLQEGTQCRASVAVPTPTDLLGFGIVPSSPLAFLAPLLSLGWGSMAPPNHWGTFLPTFFKKSPLAFLLFLLLQRLKTFLGLVRKLLGGCSPTEDAYIL